MLVDVTHLIIKTFIQLCSLKAVLLQLNFISVLPLSILLNGAIKKKTVTALINEHETHNIVLSCHLCFEDDLERC